MPRGPAFISMGCCMCICARSGDAAPAMSTSKNLRMSRSPQAKVASARRSGGADALLEMTDLGLRRWREWRGEVGIERGVRSQNPGTGCGTHVDSHVGPHLRRGTSGRARASGDAAEAGCVLMARLARWLSD